MLGQSIGIWRAKISATPIKTIQKITISVSLKQVVPLEKNLLHLGIYHEQV